MICRENDISMEYGSSPAYAPKLALTSARPTSERQVNAQNLYALAYTPYREYRAQQA